MSAVLCRRVCKRFGRVEALRGANLEADAGAICVLMGPNGSGKTTLSSIIAGALRQDSGEVRVFGEEPERARDRLSFMLQDAFLSPTLTGMENLKFFARLYGADPSRVSELIDALGLRGELNKPIKKCSGGTKRKFELAAALAPDVDLYLLDEPTAALDPDARREVLNMLLDMKRRGKTILVVTHIPYDAEVADKLVYMADGRDVASGRPSELLGGVPTVVRAIPRASAFEVEGALSKYAMGGFVYRKGCLLYTSPSPRDRG